MSIEVLSDFEDADAADRLPDGARQPGKTAGKDWASVSNSQPGALPDFFMFFPWLFCLAMLSSQQLVEAENLPCLAVFDGMLILLEVRCSNRRRSISFCEQLLANSCKKPLGNYAGLRWNPRRDCMMLLHSVSIHVYYIHMICYIMIC